MVGPFQFRVGGKVEENVPRNILEKILWLKDGEVAAFKERTPPSALALALDGAPPARDFVGALRACEAETGDAHPDRGGEEGGSIENLELIRAAGMGSPLLCKDFVVDAWQLYCARTKGADTVLLIATVLPDQDLEREMERVLALEGITLISINNRNLGTFKVDLGNTQQLLAKERGAAIRERGIMVRGGMMVTRGGQRLRIPAPHAPHAPMVCCAVSQVVGESGLFIPGDVAFVQKAGCNAVSRRMPAQLALIVSTSVYPPRLHPLLPSSTRLPPQVLVGESQVRTSDPTAAIAALFGRPLTTHQPGQPEPAQAQALA
ncbi:unnamed protein product [Closterium sp. NIES-64]|nr:unnamed protein product [Closterium sp. NIES-64]